MKIIVLSRALFNEYLTRKGVTNENVEQQDKLFFISINNQDDKTPSFFTSNKKNVLNITFADLEEDKELPILGENRTETFKAMTREQAAELYAFIKANKDKEAVFIHCTAGVARSGAVGVFINDFIGGNYHELMRNNPSIQPNPHVYRLLHDEWYKDIAHNDAITGEPLDNFRVEIINPKTPEQEVAAFNERHPDQQTSIEFLTKEQIKEKYGDEFDGGKIKPYLQDEIGQMPVAEYKGRGYQKGDTELIGARFTHPDGSSTYVAAVDPHRTEPEFDQFWLETDKYYGMVTEGELNVLRYCHPGNEEFFKARKKILPDGEFEAFAEFGIGDEYTGIDLGTWLRLKNMLSFFNN